MASKRSRKPALKSGEKGDRDPAGRFVQGHSQPGPGRPPGAVLDFRAIVAAKAKQEGVSLEGSVWAVTRALLEQAEKGDAMAAKLEIGRAHV